MCVCICIAFEKVNRKQAFKGNDDICKKITKIKSFCRIFKLDKLRKLTLNCDNWQRLEKPDLSKVAMQLIRKLGSLDEEQRKKENFKLKFVIWFLG